MAGVSDVENVRAESGAVKRRKTDKLSLIPKEQVKFILGNRVEIVENLDTTGIILDNLLQDNVINQEFYNQLRQENDAAERNRQLLDKILKGSAKQLEDFIRNLKTYKQAHIAALFERPTENNNTEEQTIPDRILTSVTNNQVVTPMKINERDHGTDIDWLEEFGERFTSAESLSNPGPDWDGADYYIHDVTDIKESRNKHLFFSVTLQNVDGLYERAPCYDLDRHDFFRKYEQNKQCISLSNIWNSHKNKIEITQKTSHKNKIEIAQKNRFFFSEPDFNFIPPNPELIKEIKNSPNKMIIDVEVVVMKAIPAISIKWKKRLTKIQNVVIADSSSAICCELWGEYSCSLQENQSYNMKYLKIMGDAGYKYLKTTKLTKIQPTHDAVKASEELEQVDIDNLGKGPYEELNCKVSAINSVHKYEKCPFDWIEIPKENNNGKTAKCPPRGCKKTFPSSDALQEIVLNIDVRMIDERGSYMTDDYISLSAWSNSLNELIDESEEFWALEEENIHEILFDKKFRVKYNKVKRTVASILYLEDTCNNQ